MNANGDNYEIFNNLTFYIYPCAIRATIRELVTKNGGTFSGTRGAGVIFLTENKSFKQGVHVDFVYDSIKTGKLLEQINYELPKYALKDATNIISIQSSKVFSSRNRYEPEEDEAILQYIAKHRQEYGQTGSVTGNTIWKQMERDKVTLHPWQSMKDRYLKQLKHKSLERPFEALQLVEHKGKQIFFANNPSPQKCPAKNLCMNNMAKKTKNNQENDLSKNRKRKLFTKCQAVFDNSSDCSNEDINISSFDSDPDKTCDDSNVSLLNVSNAEPTVRPTSPNKNSNSECSQEQLCLQKNVVSSTSDRCEKQLQVSHESDLSKENVLLISADENSVEDEPTQTSSSQTYTKTLSQFVKPFLAADETEDSFDADLFENAVPSSSIKLKHLESSPSVVKNDNSFTVKDNKNQIGCSCQWEGFLNFTVSNDKITQINEQLMINEFCFDKSLTVKEFQEMMNT